MDMVLDVNIDIYPVEVGDQLKVALSQSLVRGGNPTPATYEATILSGRSNLLDEYEYVMHGKVFKFKDSGAAKQFKAEVYVSFGGLLMQLTGDPKQLEKLDIDQTIYLLIKKV